MKNLDGHSETRNGHRKTAERPKAEPYSSKKSILSNDSIMNGLKVEETTSDPGLDSGKNPKYTILTPINYHYFAPLN